MKSGAQEPERQLVDRLVDLIAIRSLSGQEEAVSRYILDALAGSGADLEADAAGNVAAILAPAAYKATLHVAGHMDTVPPGAGWTVDPYAATVRPDRIIGLGASDMKAGLSGMMWCVERFAANGPRNLRLIFDFTICEEGPAPGKRNGVYDACERYGGQYAITTEASGAGDGRHFPAVGSQGHLRATATFQGRAAHSAYPEKGVNAIGPACRFVERVAEYNERLRGRWRPLWEQHRQVMARPCAAATRIDGGIAVNVIPDRCVVQVSRRTAPGETLEAVAAELLALLEDLGEAELQVGRWEDPCITPPDSPLIAAGRVALQEAAQTFRPRLSRGRQDVVIFARYGMHTYNIGPGSAGSGHAADEYCMKCDLISGAHLLDSTIRNLDERVPAE